MRGATDAFAAEPAPHPPAPRGLLADRLGAAARRPIDVHGPLGCRMTAGAAEHRRVDSGARGSAGHAMVPKTVQLVHN